MKQIIEQNKALYKEAESALRFSKMMSIDERHFYAFQKKKAGKKLESFGIYLNEL